MEENTENTSQNYKRIAKNTLLLYTRFTLTLFISLYTSRIILQALGFNDFGLYNVVGGFISLLAFLNSYITQGTTRFLTFALGQEDIDRLKTVFSAAFAIHLALALLILLAGETIGIWYVENKLNIQSGRENAAMFVYQLSLITAVLSILQTPFRASITSHEDMGIYAYISIFDVVMKLVIVYLLMVIYTDKLKMFALFTFIVSLMTSCFYVLYCLRKYSECQFRLKPDLKLYYEMFNYIGWNAIGTIAFTLNGQGITVLLNMFFGTVVNAARGVAGSLSNIVSQFVFNFQTAMRPQIVKQYAQGNIKEMEKLIVYGAKYSSYMCMLFGIPIFIESDTILRIWLGNIPPYASTFVKLSIIQIMIQAIDFPVGYGINAVGKMKLPNITSSLIYLLILPISYIAMKLGANPTVAYLISIICYPGAFLFDIWILHKYIGFNIAHYITHVPLKTTLFVVTASIIPMMIHNYMTAGFWRLSTVTMISLLISCPLIFYKGLDSTTRTLVLNKIKSKIPGLH
ncbi:MATE family efflux transporter [Segatella bryantii]|jgi:Na+-driven multidrug efflux pump|uniref:MATE family efflux transporter n=1 Tax=Segatella bryantii TaxID=77095 RepID=UPI000883C1C4|nr:MATE family efflux transporter [Segatella bryantii]SDL70941.1 Na+-driven multidrug efflux pump [Segatella bryantii]